MVIVHWLAQMISAIEVFGYKEHFSPTDYNLKL